MITNMYYTTRLIHLLLVIRFWVWWLHFCLWRNYTAWIWIRAMRKCSGADYLCVLIVHKRTRMPFSTNRAQPSFLLLCMKDSSPGESADETVLFTLLEKDGDWIRSKIPFPLKQYALILSLGMSTGSNPSSVLTAENCLTEVAEGRRTAPDDANPPQLKQTYSSSLNST